MVDYEETPLDAILLSILGLFRNPKNVSNQTLHRALSLFSTLLSKTDDFQKEQLSKHNAAQVISDLATNQQDKLIFERILSQLVISVLPSSSETNEMDFSIRFQDTPLQTEREEEDRLERREQALQGTLSFPFVQLSKAEEQKIFDLNCALRYRGPVDIANCLEILHSCVLEDIPVEYFLQNSEVLKTFLLINEKASGYEMGSICLKIMLKLVKLLENKQKYFDSDISVVSKKTEDIYLNEDPPVYPLTEANYDALKNCLSLRDFLLLAIDSCVLSCTKPERTVHSVGIIRKLVLFIRKQGCSPEVNAEILASFGRLVSFGHTNCRVSFVFQSICDCFFFFLEGLSVDQLDELAQIEENFSSTVKKALFNCSQSHSVLDFLKKTAEFTSLTVKKDFQIIRENYTIALKAREAIKIAESYVDYSKIAPEELETLLSSFEALLFAGSYADFKVNYGKMLFDMLELVENPVEIEHFFFLSFSCTEENVRFSLVDALKDEMKHRNGVFRLFRTCPQLFVCALELLKQEDSKTYSKLLEHCIKRSTEEKETKLLSIVSLANVFQYKDLKSASLQLKIESLDSKVKVLGYIRNLFHSEDFVRANTLYFLQGNINDLSSKYLEYCNISGFSSLINTDVKGFLQIASSQVVKLKNSALSLDYTSTLKTIYSKTIELNLKSTAIEQFLVSATEKPELLEPELLTHLVSEMFVLVSEYTDFTYFGVDFPVKMPKTKLAYLNQVFKALNCYFVFRGEQSEVGKIFVLGEDWTESGLIRLVKIAFSMLFCKATFGCQSALFLYLVGFNKGNFGDVAANLGNLEVFAFADHFYKTDLLKNVWATTQVKEVKTVEIFEFLEFKRSIEPCLAENKADKRSKCVNSLVKLVKEGEDYSKIFIGLYDLFTVSEGTKLDPFEIGVIFSFFKRLSMKEHSNRELATDFLRLIPRNLLKNEYFHQEFSILVNCFLVGAVNLLEEEQFEGYEAYFSELSTWLSVLGGKESKISLDAINQYFSGLSKTFIFTNKLYDLKLAVLKGTIRYFTLLELETKREILNNVDLFLCKADRTVLKSIKAVKLSLILVKLYSPQEILQVSQTIVKFVLVPFPSVCSTVFGILTKIAGKELLQKHDRMLEIAKETVINRDLPSFLKVSALSFMSAIVEDVFGESEDLVTLNEDIFGPASMFQLLVSKSASVLEEASKLSLIRLVLLLDHKVTLHLVESSAVTVIEEKLHTVLAKIEGNSDYLCVLEESLAILLLLYRQNKLRVEQINQKSMDELFHTLVSIFEELAANRHDALDDQIDSCTELWFSLLTLTDRERENVPDLTFRLTAQSDKIELKTAFCCLIPIFYKRELYFSAKTVSEALLTVSQLFKTVYKVKVENFKGISYIFDSSVKGKTFIFSSLVCLLREEEQKKLFFDSQIISMFTSYLRFLSDKMNKVNLKEVASVTFGNLGAVGELKKEVICLLNVFQSFFSNSSVNDQFMYRGGKPTSLLSSLVAVQSEMARQTEIYQEYLKILVNMVRKNDLAREYTQLLKPSLLKTISEEYKQQLRDKEDSSFSLLSAFLRSVAQSPRVVQTMLRDRFIEDVYAFISESTLKKAKYGSKAVQHKLSDCVCLLTSLSFRLENTKKTVNVETIKNLLEIVTKVRNWSLVEDILLFLRNVSFLKRTKMLVKYEKELLSTLFGFLSVDTPLKVTVLVGNVLWVLLYDNMNMKALLNNPKYKEKIVSCHISIQRRLDELKFLGETEEKGNEQLLSEGASNFEVILHLLELA